MLTILLLFAGLSGPGLQGAGQKSIGQEAAGQKDAGREDPEPKYIRQEVAGQKDAGQKDPEPKYIEQKPPAQKGHRLSDPGRKGRLVVLTLTPDNPASSFSLEPAALKYNKDFAWSFTLDDGYVSAFLVAFPYFNGGQVAASYIDQWGHDQGGDGGRYPGLFFTDGCGNKVPFRAAVAINARSLVDSLAGNTRVDEQGRTVAGSARIDHPGTLSWQQVSQLYHAGWDIFNHGYTHATGGGVDAEPEVRRNNEAVAAHLGFQMSQFVVPGGKDGNLSQEPYAQAAFEQGLLSVHDGGFPKHWALTEEKLPVHWRVGRQFISSRVLWDSSGKTFHEAAFFDEWPDLLRAGKKAWINVFAHSVGNDDLWGISLRFNHFKELFDTLAVRYGEKGQDNMWMASFQAVQEYRLIRQSLKYTVRKKGAGIVLVFDPAKLPPGLRHRTMTFLWKSEQSVKSIRCRGCVVESFSHAGSPQLINIRW